MHNSPLMNDVNGKNPSTVFIYFVLMKNRTEVLLWEHTVLLAYPGLCLTRQLKLARCLTGIMLRGSQSLNFLSTVCWLPKTSVQKNSVQVIGLFFVCWTIYHFHVLTVQYFLLPCSWLSVANVYTTRFVFSLRNTRSQTGGLPTGRVGSGGNSIKKLN